MNALIIPRENTFQIIPIADWAAAFIQTGQAYPIFDACMVCSDQPIESILPFAAEGSYITPDGDIEPWPVNIVLAQRVQSCPTSYFSPELSQILAHNGSDDETSSANPPAPPSPCEASTATP